MKVTRYIGKKLKFMVDFPSWMSWHEVRGHGSNIYQVALAAFTPQAKTRHESFEQAMARMKITETKLQQRARHILMTMVVYVAALLALLAYVMVLFGKGHLAAGLLGCAVMSVPAILVYRESFYYMQIKQRRLGCTFKDWLAWVKGGQFK